MIYSELFIQESYNYFMLYKMNIDDIYFQLVRSGQKKHEYRLNDEKRQQIKVGDEILLVNNLDSKQTFLVTVKDIKVYKDWRSALESTYKEDFLDVYNSLEETIEACSKFYSKEDVEKYGIVSFEIK